MAILDEIRHYPLGSLMVTHLIFLMRGHRLVPGSVVGTTGGKPGGRFREWKV